MDTSNAVSPSWSILRHLGPMLDYLGSMLGHLEACWRSVGGLLVNLMHMCGVWAPTDGSDNGGRR
eukprot:2922300-Karenia_brevis.AAC.1